MLKILNSCSSL